MIAGSRAGTLLPWRFSPGQQKDSTERQRDSFLMAGTVPLFSWQAKLSDFIHPIARRIFFLEARF